MYFNFYVFLVGILCRQPKRTQVYVPKKDGEKDGKKVKA